MDKEVEKADGKIFKDADEIRLVKNAFPDVFLDGRICTSIGVEIEHNKYVGPVWTIMRLLTHKDGDLPTYFDAIVEKRGADANTLLKPKLFGNHANDYNKVKKRHLPLECIFEIWNRSKIKRKKNIRVRITIKNFNIKTTFNFHNNRR